MVLDGKKDFVLPDAVKIEAEGSQYNFRRLPSEQLPEATIEISGCHNSHLQL
jgi:hypothetical protein